MLVAIVGRPNVGKSTLFNRLTKTRHAIVSDEAGTTRDRQYGKCEWVGHEFSVVDTGGWVVNSDDIFEEEIRKQVTIATEEADVILFLVDINTGVTDLDEAVAAILRRTEKPVILVANKTDNSDQQWQAADFYRLGLGDPFCISSATGSGTGDLLDLVLEKLPKEADSIEAYLFEQFKLWYRSDPAFCAAIALHFDETGASGGAKLLEAYSTQPVDVRAAFATKAFIANPDDWEACASAIDNLLVDVNPTIEELYQYTSAMYMVPNGLDGQYP